MDFKLWFSFYNYIKRVISNTQKFGENRGDPLDKTIGHRDIFKEFKDWKDQDNNQKGYWYHPQSGEEEVGQTVMEALPSVDQQIVSFNDDNAGMMTGVDSVYEPTMDISTDINADLATYLGRPVEIDTTSWLVYQPLFHKINPWKLWRDDPWVAAKLANYELIRAKLCVKFVINGTKFHYGKVMVGYNPMRGPFDEVTQTRNFLDQDLVQLSQKPHVFLDSSTSEGAQMCLPWFWYENYISLTKGDIQYMGDLYYKSLGNLLSASSGTDPVQITTYAWVEDLVLTMPTTLNVASAMEPQAASQKKGKPKGKAKKPTPKAMNSGQDEYGKGIISQPAQAIAKAAGALEVIPFIAPYARASQMVATKVGQIASLFGYSRPNVLSDVEPFRPELMGKVANVNASDTSHKLSLDSKQEVSIDSRVAGLDGEDQMTCNSIVTRESYVTSFIMDESDASGKILWNTYINPAMAAYLGDEIHMTPMAFWSQHFNYWQGSIKLRFQVVKSQFHRGRILLRWDPRSNNSTINTNSQYSRVVDLSDTDDFEIVIGWGQSAPFLNCITCQPGAELYSTTRLTTDNSDFHNGVLEVDVINNLVSPDGASPIRINVFASMCDDAKFGQPVGNRISALSPFVPQSGFEPQSGEEKTIDGNAMTAPTSGTKLTTIAEEGAPSDETMNVFFGESITSLRELLKRYYFTRAVSKPDLGENELTISKFKSKAQPYVAGWDQFGLDVAADDTTPLTIGVNGPIQLWNLCYAGWRGSLRHKFVYSSNIEGSLRVRRVEHNNAYGYTQQTELTTKLDGDITKFLSAKTFRESYDGSHINHSQYNKVLEFEIPFYTGKRYLPARQTHATSTLGDAFEIGETFVSTNNAPKKVYVEDYVAAGDDYSLMFFTGVPVLYRYYLLESSRPSP